MQVLVTISVEIPVLDGAVDVVRGDIGSAPAAVGMLVGPTDRVGVEELSTMPDLKVLAVAGAGTDGVDAQELRKRGVILVSAPDTTAGPTAEVTMCLALMVSRGIKTAVHELETGRWSGWSFNHVVGRNLAGLTLGIVGYGRIGRRVAQLANAFDMDVIHHSRRDTNQPGYRGSLSGLLAESDIVSLHVPLTSETSGLMSAEAIAQMRPGSALINTSRGVIVNENAVLAALASGHLSGVGLDVFADEPRVPEHLLGVPNLIVTPHVGTATSGARSAMANEAATNLLSELRAMNFVDRGDVD